MPVVGAGVLSLNSRFQTKDYYAVVIANSFSAVAIDLYGDFTIDPYSGGDVVTAVGNIRLPFKPRRLRMRANQGGFKIGVDGLNILSVAVSPRSDDFLVVSLTQFMGRHNVQVATGTPFNWEFSPSEQATNFVVGGLLYLGFFSGAFNMRDLTLTSLSLDNMGQQLLLEFYK